GSLVLGYVLSAICILLVQNTDGVNSVLPISMAIVVGLPIVDALLVMTIRMSHGRNPFLPDKTHLHYRLMSLGLNHPNVVWIMYFAMFSCGLLAVLVAELVEWQQFAIGGFYASLLFGSIYILQRVKGQIGGR
ncbi:MAG: hypothetical protein V3V89_00385, partial [Gammaproteobacteria bacterium]